MTPTTRRLNALASSLNIHGSVDTATFSGGPRGEAHKTHSEYVLVVGRSISERLGANRADAAEALKRIGARIAA